MKSFQRLFAVVVLTLIFALPASAGIMECGVAPPPPPAPATTQGEMECGIAPVTDSFTEAMLNLLTGVLSLV